MYWDMVGAVGRVAVVGGGCVNELSESKPLCRGKPLITKLFSPYLDVSV